MNRTTDNTPSAGARRTTRIICRLKLAVNAVVEKTYGRKLMLSEMLTVDLWPTVLRVIKTIIYYYYKPVLKAQKFTANFLICSR